eukprot:m.159701 g.159701  ORF g.159701 m.159701 type:complete len:122 (+) comp17609_c1_seq1:153-518(+)
MEAPGSPSSSASWAVGVDVVRGKGHDEYAITLEPPHCETVYQGQARFSKLADLHKQLCEQVPEAEALPFPTKFGVTREAASLRKRADELRDYLAIAMTTTRAQYFWTTSDFLMPLFCMRSG